MKIKVLASSSAGNAYLISDGETNLLLECGISFDELKIKTKFFDPPVDACLISHSHGDHARSAAQLTRLGIPCYMSKDTLVEIGGDLTRSSIEVMEHEKTFHVGTFGIKPLKMAHDVYCLGFFIYSYEKRQALFFATDTFHIPYRLPSVDYIMVEANYDINILNDRIVNGYVDPAMKNRLARSHMEIGTTIQWLEKQDLKRTKRIYLLHLSHGSSNEAEFRQRVMEATGVPVTIAGG